MAQPVRQCTVALKAVLHVASTGLLYCARWTSPPPERGPPARRLPVRSRPAVAERRWPSFGSTGHAKVALTIRKRPEGRGHSVRYDVDPDMRGKRRKGRVRRVLSRRLRRTGLPPSTGDAITTSQVSLNVTPRQFEPAQSDVGGHMDPLRRFGLVAAAAV